jgi:predicted alpha/beta superfamily hydrolase
MCQTLLLLFNQPDTFKRYIMGSPSIWWEDRVVMKDAREFVDTHSDLPMWLFIDVSELEEAAASGMVTNMFQLESLLQSANLKELEMSSDMLPNETHFSVIAMS